MMKALKNGGGCLVTTFTSLAALSPAWTAPSMYPDHWVAVSVPAKYKLPTGLLISLRTTNICLSCDQGKKNFFMGFIKQEQIFSGTSSCEERAEKFVVLVVDKKL